MSRTAYHLSLRHDDDFEESLAEAIQNMPRGYAKLAIVNMISEFIPRGTDDYGMLSTLMDFARDVHPKRLITPPKMAPLPPRRTGEAEATATRQRPARQPMRRIHSVGAGAGRRAAISDPDSLEFDFPAEGSATA